MRVMLTDLKEYIRPIMYNNDNTTYYSNSEDLILYYTQRYIGCVVFHILHNIVDIFYTGRSCAVPITPAVL